MADTLDVTFVSLTTAPEAVCAVLAAEGMKLGPRGRALDEKTGGRIVKAAEAAAFKGKAKTGAEVLAPDGLDIKRLILVGSGATAKASDLDWTLLGGYALGQIVARKTPSASLFAEVSDTGDLDPAEIAAWLAEGAVLRHYNFRKYLTKPEGEPVELTQATKDEAGPVKTAAAKRDDLERLVIHCAHPDKARAVFARRLAVVNGVNLARDLVNEPANVLGPVEFADAARALEKAGCEVEILDAEALQALGMNCLLAIAQGSVRPARVAVMQWHGAKSRRSKPLAFVGKGVVFDTGGYSIKPAAGMEDMKGDMGGAAAVTGLMRTLAERKANVNAVGLIGIVENMVSGNATRPGDIVVSMSGQTVEVLNTDAEGRLVLADVLWYTQQRFKPRLIIDLATLTGAIMVALGKDFAGMFANDDKLASDLMQASTATGEKVWRMPLDKAYDKLIDSKNADVKNLGGRWAGACTAAAFLQRFIKDTPWAHLDIAGTAMDAPKNDINPSWGSGWGVRLLDRFVADHYEKSKSD